MSHLWLCTVTKEGKTRELNVYLLLPPFLNIVFLDIEMEYNIHMYVDIFQSVDSLILLRT